LGTQLGREKEGAFRRMKFIDNYIRSLLNEYVDKGFTRLIRDQYTENLFEMVPVSKKVGVINLIELAMRAGTGNPPARPLGSHLQMSPWDKLLFNPVHLYRFPTQENVPIATAVTIGPKALRPLTVAIPILIGGMSFGGALSKSTKIALAKGAAMAGTASNSGEAGLLEEERQAASLLIGQYNRGGWLNRPDKYKKLDAIEIQLGQGAQGSAPQRTSGKNIGPDFREVFQIQPGQDALIKSRLLGINTKEDFISLVKSLRNDAGVPVGLKLAATHHLEEELRIALEAGVDFVAVDGAEGGTHAAAPVLEDDLGLPCLYAVSRTAQFFKDQGVFGEVSIIASGGLITPGQILKAMALGADCVYIGTAAVMALVGDQMAGSLPFEPPVSLVVYNAKMTDKLDINKGAQNLFRFLNATVRQPGHPPQNQVLQH
jgi:glutamate synthase domain-containing protein 2